MGRVSDSLRVPISEAERLREAVRILDGAEVEGGAPADIVHRLLLDAKYYESGEPDDVYRALCAAAEEIKRQRIRNDELTDQVDQLQIVDIEQEAKDTADLAARRSVIADQEKEIERLRGVIDCGCNAIRDAIDTGGEFPHGDIRRIMALQRRMQREKTVEVDDA